MDKNSDNDIFEAANEELTRLSAAFSNANEALGKLTYLIGNIGRMYKNCEGPKCTRDIPHRPEVQSVKIGIQDDTGGARVGVKTYEPRRGRDLRDIVNEILGRSSYDVPRKCVRYRMPQDGVIEFLIQKSSSGFSSSESFRVELHDDLRRTAAMFDEAIESLHGLRFGRKMGFGLADLLESYFDADGGFGGDGGWNSL